MIANHQTLTILAPHDLNIFARVTQTGEVTLYQRQSRTARLLGTLHIGTDHLPHHLILDRVADALSTYRP